MRRYRVFFREYGRKVVRAKTHGDAIQQIYDLFAEVGLADDIEVMDVQEVQDECKAL